LTIELPDGRTLGVAEWGDPSGAPFMYFHGLPGSRLDVAGSDSDFAAAGVRVIAPDRPGFGRSSFQRDRSLLDWPRDMAAVAEELGLEGFPVVGYSSGGKYALACAFALPERVSATGLIGAVGPPDLPRFYEISGPSDRRSMRLAARARPLAIAYWHVGRLTSRHRPEALLARLEHELSEPDRRVLADERFRESVMVSFREALRPGPRGVVHDFLVQTRPWGFRLEEVPAPVRIWHGDEDRIVPFEQGRLQAERIPDAELTVFEGEGHLLEGRFAEIAAALRS